ncbi:MAG: glutamine amidotransferase [Chloroflexota bacterium]|nr:glutamine amidotransferase [Chloroflexota bacterium]
MDLRIAFLYPELMNIYGDRGNILTLSRRALWRGIDVTVDKVSLGDTIDPGYYDFFFFGGGQDKQQVAVAHDLQGQKGGALREAVEGGAVMLSVCGGYQLLGRYYRPADDEDLPGIGLFDAHTEASDTRYIGNVLIDCSLPGVGTIVAFENHSGRTYLGPGCKPLGKSLIGGGNNGQDGTEGAVYKTAYGCYLHGSLLPKNPRFADLLLTQALSRRHGQVELASIDDTLEDLAHSSAVGRARATR